VPSASVFSSSEDKVLSQHKLYNSVIQGDATQRLVESQCLRFYPSIRYFIGYQLYLELLFCYLKHLFNLLEVILGQGNSEK
jgi:hypothetical protein